MLSLQKLGSVEKSHHPADIILYPVDLNYLSLITSPIPDLITVYL